MLLFYIRNFSRYCRKKIKRDTKYVLRIILNLLLFLALYNQQGSKWKWQAIQLDGNIVSFNFCLNKKTTVKKYFVQL